MVKIYTDDFEVISSGSFILKDKNANAKLHINLLPRYNFQIDMVFTFLKERTGSVAHVEQGRWDEEVIELVISNTEEPLGNGTCEIMPLAKFTDGKGLYCNYIFSRPTPENPRLFTYSLYIEG